MKTLVLLGLLCAPLFATAQGVHSGVVGHVFLIVCPVVPPGGCPPRPYQATISVLSEKGKLVERITTDADGLFGVYLQPGIYRLVPDGPPPPHKWPYAYPLDVRVDRRRFSEVTINYATGL